MKNTILENEKKTWTSQKSWFVGRLTAYKYVNQLFWFALSFVYAGGMLMAGHYPFGAALVAAYCLSEHNLVISLGAFLGYVFFLGGAGLPYCGAVIVCAACGVMLRNQKVSTGYLPLISAISMIFTVGAINLGQPVRELVLTACEIAVCASFTYFYVAYRENKSDDGRLAGRVAMVLTLVLALSQVQILGVVSPARVAICFLLLLYVYSAKNLGSVVAAIAAGGLMDLNGGISPYFSGAYGIAIVAVYMVRHKSRLAYAGVFAFLLSMIVLWSPENTMAMALIWEGCIGAALFALLPECTIASMGGSFLQYNADKEDKPAAPQQENRYVKERLEALSSAISNVSDTLLKLSEKPNKNENITRVFDRAADCVCRKCPISMQCWDKDHMTTYNALNDVTAALRKNGYVRGEDFPHHFSNRCLNLSKLIGHINEEYGLWQRRMVAQNGDNQEKKLIARQYMGINRAIENIAENMDKGPRFYPEYEERICRILSFYDKNARATVYSVGGRTSIEIYNCSADLQVDMPQLLDSLSLCLGKEFLPPEEIQAKDGLVLRVREREKYRVKIHVGVREKKGEEICGDNYSYFTTDDGRAVVMLSDGMGSGQAASVASKNAISLISRFIQAGCSMEESVTAVLPAIAAGVERMGFATLDLLEINLFSGEARLLKYGAPPSYIKRFQKVQKYMSAAFPPGLEQENAPPNKSSFVKLSEENTVIMGTDGVFDSENIAQIESLLKSSGSTAQQLTTELIEKAYKAPNRLEDDMTVIVVQLEKQPDIPLKQAA